MPGRLILFAIIVTVLSGCASSGPGDPAPADRLASSPGLLPGTALAWSPEGSSLLQTSPDPEGCTARWIDARSGAVRSVVPLEECPAAVRFLDDGTALAVGPRASWLVTGDAASPTLLLDRAANGAEIERAEGGVRIGAERIRLDGEVVSARWIPKSAKAVAHVRGGGTDRLLRVAAGEPPAPLTDPYEEIDSFDLDPHGNELVFSVKRDGGFDVAIAPTEPGEPKWIPADPLDERGVSWAPRGNKVTYAIEGGTGTVLRTVHLPTGFQLAISLAWSRVGALAWDPGAERFAVVLGSPDRSERVEVMRYGGEERRVLLAPRSELSSRAEVLAGVEGAVLLAPASVRYGEKVPAVVWVETRPLEWSEERARLHQNRGVTTVVVPERSAGWVESVRTLPWVDPERIFVVVERPSGELIRSLASAGATVLSPDEPEVGGLEVVRTGSRDRRRVAAEWIESRLESATTR